MLGIGVANPISRGFGPSPVFRVKGKRIDFILERTDLYAKD
jgi:hypothetical protein